MNTETNVTRAEFEALLERIEDLEDAVFLERVEAESAKREYLPVDLVERLLAGEHAVRIWREYRGLSVRGLADAAEIDPAYLSQIETGKKPGSLNALRALAKALNVSLDDLAG
jgi:ribosome-binding protein aMBF1 (putative translation factor)